MELRRVVVTGLGAVTPLGVGVEHSWKRLLDGASGAGRITLFDPSDLSVTIGCEIPRGDAPGEFNVDDVLPPKDQRKVDNFIIYALAAAAEAIADAGWEATNDEEAERTGVMIGSGIGGLATISEAALVLQERGPRRISPFFIPSSLINLASGHVSIRHGFKGPNHAPVTACSTGAHAIGDASRLISFGDADVMVAGGSEAAICRLGVVGFAAARALSSNFNDEPWRASRPGRCSRPRWYASSVSTTACFPARRPTPRSTSLPPAPLAAGTATCGTRTASCSSKPCSRPVAPSC